MDSAAAIEELNAAEKFGVMKRDAKPGTKWRALMEQAERDYPIQAGI
jgi:hypothetical protein